MKSLEWIAADERQRAARDRAAAHNAAVEAKRNEPRITPAMVGRLVAELCKLTAGHRRDVRDAVDAWVKSENKRKR